MPQVAIADKASTDGASYNNGAHLKVIDVTDENITREEFANPVQTLRRRYDAWKAQR